MKTYKVLKYYQNGTRPRVMYKNLTIEQARRICSDPETSSRTAQNACNGNEKTIARWHEKQKHWFYGFEEE